MENVEFKKLHIGTDRFTKILYDPYHESGVPHRYKIMDTTGSFELGDVSFQDGPVPLYGINGVHHEDLLAIVIDRLCRFQDGKFSCRENEMAVTKLKEALHWLNQRTLDRQSREVEGTYNP
jgi:hypothetical protein